MLRISEATSLALHAMGILAESKGYLISTDTMTEAMGASKNHLQKVLQRLARAGLVDATRGPSGGFKLAIDPSEISLMDIYIAMEGPLHLQGCILGNTNCSREKCVMGDLVKEVNDGFQKYFYQTSLADLAESKITKQEDSK
ncbi:MAG: Rrf2 family transcriptional regulator [Armatimonadetes bacterium]|nr:Rrf2 family transcriptional regulator [Armatimonadota bacterium]